MSGPSPGERPRHERGPVAELARLFLGQLAAVIAIAAAIVVVVALVGPDGNDDIRAVTPGASSTEPDTGTPSSSTPAASSSSPAPSSSTPVEETTPSTTAPAAGGPVKVDVLNQSAAQGAAGRVADRLRGAGWKIGRIDDFRGNVSTTTVYWLEPEQRRQARQISRFLGGVRVLEGFDTLVDGRVSVILVDGDW